MSSSNIEDRIRDRAYALWDQAGRPDGNDKEFWHLAEKQLSEGSGVDQSEEDSEVGLPPLPAGLPTH